MPRTKGAKNKPKWMRTMNLCPRLKKGNQPRLNITDLAKAIGRNRRYVSVMRRAGFKMIEGKATYNEAVKWLYQNRRWFTTTISSSLPRLKDQIRDPEENIRQY